MLRTLPWRTTWAWHASFSTGLGVELASGGAVGLLIGEKLRLLERLGKTKTRADDIPLVTRAGGSWPLGHPEDQRMRQHFRHLDESRGSPSTRAALQDHRTSQSGGITATKDDAEVIADAICPWPGEQGAKYQTCGASPQGTYSVKRSLQAS